MNVEMKIKIREHNNTPIVADYMTHRSTLSVLSVSPCLAEIQENVTFQPKTDENK